MLSVSTHKVVYFHIEEVARDAIVAAGLKAELARDGVRLEYGNRRESARLGKRGRFDEYDLYIFPSLDAFRVVCHDPTRIESPVIILPTESIGGKFEHISRTAAKFFGAFPSENKPWFDKISLFCIWGDNHRRVFTEYAPELASKAFLVGHPRMDKRCFPKRMDSGTHTRRKVVGFTTRFSSFNDFAKRSTFLQIFNARKHYYVGEDKTPLGYLYDMDKDIEDILYKEIGDFRIMLDLIYYLKNESVQIKVRVHPRENRLEWQRLIDEQGLPVEMSPWDEPFSWWLQNVDYVISPASTSFYDCFIAGVKPICTNDLLPYRKSHLFSGDVDTGEMLNHVFLPKTFEELADYIRSGDYRGATGPAISADLETLLRFETGYPDCYRSHALLREAISSVLANSAAGASRKLSRAVFRAKGLVINALRPIVHWQEQGSTFCLTKARKKWIDRLVA